MIQEIRIGIDGAGDHGDIEAQKEAVIFWIGMPGGSSRLTFDRAHERSSEQPRRSGKDYCGIGTASILRRCCREMVFVARGREHSTLYSFTEHAPRLQ